MEESGGNPFLSKVIDIAKEDANTKKECNNAIKGFKNIKFNNVSIKVDKLIHTALSKPTHKNRISHELLEIDLVKNTTTCENMAIKRINRIDFLIENSKVDTACNDVKLKLDTSSVKISTTSACQSGNDKENNVKLNDKLLIGIHSIYNTCDTTTNSILKTNYKLVDKNLENKNEITDYEVSDKGTIKNMSIIESVVTNTCTSKQNCVNPNDIFNHFTNDPNLDMEDDFNDIADTFDTCLEFRKSLDISDVIKFDTNMCYQDYDEDKCHKSERKQGRRKRYIYSKVRGMRLSSEDREAATFGDYYRTNETAELKSSQISLSGRIRSRVQPYQASALDTSISSPGPSSAAKAKDQSVKKSKDKLRLFVSREYVAVRNEENGYYICQLLQHVYRTSGIIRVRWLSQVSSNSTGDVYKPDYCDEIDTGCLMTTLELRRAASGGGLVLSASERARVRSILQRALDAAAAGTTQLDVSEEHPDGLDVTLVTDESQLERKSRKRTSSKASPKTKNEAVAKVSEEESTPAKKSRSRSSKAKTKSPKKGRKSAGSTPVVASTSKTATTVTDTPKNKKKSGDKKETPTAVKGRRSTRETKSTPVSPEPSTSTGKGTRSAKKK